MFKIPKCDESDDEKESTIRSKYFIAGSILKKSDSLQAPNTSAVESAKHDKHHNRLTPAVDQQLPPKSCFTSVTREPEVNSSIDLSQSAYTSTVTRKPVIGGNNILVNPNQKGNKLLNHLRSVAYEFNDSISPAHYVMFNSCCALFLSLKYHVIYPNYIFEKLTELGNTYQLKVLLLLVDHIEFSSSLKELTKLAIRANCTLMLAWSYEEAANYIENYKLYAERSPEVIMGKQNANNCSNSQNAYQGVMEALTSVKSINKTDAVSLISMFDTFENIVNASEDELTLCPGMARQKAERLREMLFRPFIRSE